MSSDFVQMGDIFIKLAIFLQRPAVQVQLGLFVAVLLGAALIARASEGWIDRFEPQWLKDKFSSGQNFYQRMGVSLLSFFAYLLFSIIGMTMVWTVLRGQGVAAGLIDKLTVILWLVLIYHLGVTILYYFLSTPKVAYYHQRLLRPLIVTIILLLLLNNVAALSTLANTTLNTPFGVTPPLGALFAATVGFYFWAMMVGAGQEIVYSLLARRQTIDTGSLQATLTLLRYALLGLGLFIVLRQLQLDPTTIAAIVGGLSVGIGFGLHEVLSNFISGVLLLFERSLHPGDIIEIDDQMSTVESLNIRATQLRLANNTAKIIPNQTFFTSSFINYQGAHSFGASTSVQASFADDPQQVTDVLLQLVSQIPEVDKDDEPSVFLEEFGAYGITYTVYYAVHNPKHKYTVNDQLNRHIWQAFKRHGFTMPYPQQEIHVRSPRSSVALPYGVAGTVQPPANGAAGEGQQNLVNAAGD